MWSPQGELHFVSDRTGWWNLYRWRDDIAQPLHPMAAEFATPAWALATSDYGFDAQGRIVCVCRQAGAAELALLDPATGLFEILTTPFFNVASRSNLLLM